eukprot:TRINITY_DN6167_c0_g1_i1.p1 TRINITY_DN6167_c0_g1~~TRINITY_DN6167_c0_g1_i1.p1  ORF type:complete len:284 (+),score=57.22 TRINITY_DN6167_c0_g1_i1:134-985(+)
MKKNGSHDFVRLKGSALVCKEKTIEGYRIGEILGEGCSGKVKEAFDTKNKRVCAVKILRKQLIHKPAGEDNYEKEIEVLRKLNHNNCLKIFDYFVNDEKLYIVFERVNGGSLKHLCDHAPNKRLPLSQARSFFSQLVDALEYLHSLNIFHRDLKLDNLLITTEGVLKVSDFGAALYLKDRVCPPGESKCKGSPAFQPPEILSPEPVFSGAKIDIWAAGIALYMMTTGSYPFSNICMKKMIESIMFSPVPIPQWLDADLAQLIQGTLRKDYNERFTIQQIRESR